MNMLISERSYFFLTCTEFVIKNLEQQKAQNLEKINLIQPVKEISKEIIAIAKENSGYVDIKV